MPKPFPHHYHVALNWDGSTSGTLTSTDLPNIIGGPPPEFDGPGGLWSPEHLLVSAVSQCLLNTFQAIASRSNMAVTSYQADGEGIVEKTERWILFTEVKLNVKVKVAEEDIEKAERLLAKAKEYCLISNALKIPVKLEADVTSA